VSGRVIFYADKITDSMQRAMDETNRRRRRQLAHNAEHGITPRGITKSLDEVVLSTSVADARQRGGADIVLEPGAPSEAMAAALEAEMLREARDMNFEKAASLRDRLDEVRMQLSAVEGRAPKRRRARGEDGA
jgi:excinuclease ABC subunit B